ncbi:MAG TPA: hypothetical protein VGE27_05835 [Gemmatimonas sp.]|uniref:hypothetical protein n=1 Tax=Gemmatimonas sp. TaxID=1962908 RepID=UPI002ED826B2
MTSPILPKPPSAAPAPAPRDYIASLLDGNEQTAPARGLTPSDDAAMSDGGGAMHFVDFEEDSSTSSSSSTNGYVQWDTAPKPVFKNASPGRDNVQTTDSAGRMRSMRQLQSADDDHESTGDGGTVQYFSKEARKRYEVAIGERLSWKASGLLVDTGKLAALLTGLQTAGIKAGAVSANTATGKLGNANFGMGKNKAPLSPPDGYAGKAIIWVCAPGESGNASFYSNACLINKLHHSSFSVNKQVIGAGE